MIITDYASLKTAVADYLHRSDFSDERLSGFVDLGEKRLNRELRLLRQQVTEVTTLASGQNSVNLPNRWLETVDLLHADDKQPLTQNNQRDINTQRGYDTTRARPYIYSVTGGNLTFEVFADRDYDLAHTYYQAFDIATDGTNWLLEEAPDAYLYGALLEAKAFIKKQQDMSTWAQGLQTALHDLQRGDGRVKRNSRARLDISTRRRFNINRGY